MSVKFSDCTVSLISITYRFLVVLPLAIAMREAETFIFKSVKIQKICSFYLVQAYAFLHMPYDDLAFKDRGHAFQGE